MRLQSKELKDSRMHSVRYKGAFITTVLLCCLHYLGALTMIALLILALLFPNAAAAKFLLISFLFAFGTWLIAFLKRRATRCSLCKGTPLIESGARPHNRATRRRPLNYATTAIFSIIFRQKFRCMYCGTDFNFWKKPSKRKTAALEQP